MAKGIEINGELLRKEREKRACTQEQLSEQCGIAVRTLRRMESGSSSMDSLRRVSEALGLEPEHLFLSAEAGPGKRNLLQFDLLTVEFATNLVPFLEQFCEEIARVRRYVAQKLGILVPGVRLRDNINLKPGEYRILVRELVASHNHVDIESSNPVAEMRSKLAETIEHQAFRILGTEEVNRMLQDLQQPSLVEQVLPGILSLGELRRLLQDLLKEKTCIRDLALVLETLLDVEESARSHEEKVECVKMALCRFGE